jgi:hypothetical protein
MLGLSYVMKKKAGVNLYDAWGPGAVIGYRGPPALQIFGAILKAAQAKAEGDDYDAAVNWKTFTHGLGIYMPGYVAVSRLTKLISGKEPRVWTFFIKASDWTPKPRYLKRLNNMTYEDYSQFVLGLKPEHQADLNQLLADIEAMDKKDQYPPSWGPAERAKAGRIALELSRYVDKMDRDHSKKEREARRMVQQWNIADAKLALSSIGYSDKEIKEFIEENLPKDTRVAGIPWVGDVVNTVMSPFEGQTQQFLAPNPSPAGEGVISPRVQRLVNEGGVINDSNWVNDMTRRIISEKGPEAGELFRQDLAQARMYVQTNP